MITSTGGNVYDLCIQSHVLNIHVDVHVDVHVDDVIRDVERKKKERKKERHLRQWKNENESCLGWDSNPRHVHVHVP